MTVLQDPPLLTPPVAPAAVHLRPARYEPEPGEALSSPPLPPPLPAVPAEDIITTAQSVAAHRELVPVLRVAVEVLDGRRPPAHLDPIATPDVLRYWRAARQALRRGTPTRLGRMRVCLPAPDVAEVAAVCTVEGRVRALAARFERGGRGWRWTAVRLG
ncbi:Rv3235 family protein [Pseudonocardia lacus]|uniref:Rv3235 family protein n=1 Tax=Pseudonocardia lacus TaxID=2835865 RepID=UPI001BDD16D9|nr:Rv3235 family protein [Pseudonocardia lacus]